MCESILFSLLGCHGAGDPPQTVEGVENGSRVRPKLSATASKNNLKTSTVLSCDDVKIYCQRCCVSYVKSDTDVKHTCFMQPDSARRQLGQGRAMVFFDLESCYVNWIGETKHDTMSKTIWIIQRLSILFSQKLPNKSQNCIPTNLFFSEIISSNHRLNAISEKIR